jgi:hypothetical protein
VHPRKSFPGGLRLRRKPPGELKKDIYFDVTQGSPLRRTTLGWNIVTLSG